MDANVDDIIMTMFCAASQLEKSTISWCQF